MLKIIIAQIECSWEGVSIGIPHFHMVKFQKWLPDHAKYFKMSHLEHLKLFVCLNSVAAFSIKFLKSLSQKYRNSALGRHSRVWRADGEKERREILSF